MKKSTLRSPMGSRCTGTLFALLILVFGIHGCSSLNPECTESGIHSDDTLTTAPGNGCMNRKLVHCIWKGELDKSEKPGSSKVPSKWSITQYLKNLPHFRNGFSENLTDSPEPSLIKVMSKLVTNIHLEHLSNFVAFPPIVGSLRSIVPLPNRSSGSFSAVPHGNKLSPSPPLPSHHVVDDQTNLKPAPGNSAHSKNLGIGMLSAFLLLILPVVVIIFRGRTVRNIAPWTSGLSGQLQKAFIKGVPKLNRDELQTACEDFSNIINVYDGMATLYKGTLSSGVEIAVISTVVPSKKAWSKRAELAFRKKIDTFSRVNHKNFSNLIGYCVEDQPFTRMMVFEYGPNGTLFEHLHVKDLGNLDWNSRMRIAMGTAYCLQYMHELNPPIVHNNLTSKEIILTDDYAAKIADLGFWRELVVKSKNQGQNESEHSELLSVGDVETNIHSYGMLLLEIISGVLPYSEEKGNLANWASQYLNDKQTISNLTDPTLSSFNENELEVVCEVIKCCICEDVMKRPSMNEVIQKLRKAINISPEAATPRLSPLWWAELEILSAEAA